MKKVSIMIPTYNQEDCVAETIESALAQDYPNLEVIVSDDCSTDKTSQIAKKYLKDKRFKYFRNKKNLGIVSNYRKSLYDYVTGDYVLNLDGDDYLIDRRYISDAVNLIQKHNLVAVFANQKIFFEANKKLVEDKINFSLPETMDGNWFILNEVNGFFIPHMTLLYNKRRAVEIDFYNKNIINSDVESMRRMIINHRIGFINRVVGVWRNHLINESKAFDVKRIIENVEMVNSPYNQLLNNTTISKRRLEIWRKRMIKKYLVKILVKTLNLKLRKQYRDLLFLLQKKDFEIYKSIVRDPRFFLLKVLIQIPGATKLIFKQLLKKETFYEDL